MNRRDFVKTSAAAIAAPGILHAENRGQKIRLGVIGVGNRGTQVMRQFQAQPDVQVTALCDVYRPYVDRDQAAIDPNFQKYGMGGAIPKFDARDSFGDILRTQDYRELLDSKNVDAVLIATPDHWHAIQTIDAIAAGKDVYCEKPLTATVVEGRAMINAKNASKQVVAVGLNRRGSDAYLKITAEVKAGKFGKFLSARGGRFSNLAPNGIGKCPDCPPPKGFDWNRWLGPRAYRPYRYTTAPYFFRWHGDFSSQMGNWGVHYCDVMRWILGEEWPCAITAIGGKYHLDHDGDIPDTIDVTYEFADHKLIHFSIYEASTTNIIKQREVEVAGEDGVLYVGENGYDFVPQGKREFNNPKQAVRPAATYKAENKMLSDGSWGGSTANVVRDFLDRVKDRGTPLCTLETAHVSTCYAHLGNIAYKIGGRLEWDGAKERFTNSEAANQLLHYQYRDGYRLRG